MNNYRIGGLFLFRADNIKFTGIINRALTSPHKVLWYCGYPPKVFCVYIIPWFSKLSFYHTTLVSPSPYLIFCGLADIKGTVADTTIYFKVIIENQKWDENKFPKQVILFNWLRIIPVDTSLRTHIKFPGWCGLVCWWGFPKLEVKQARNLGTEKFSGCPCWMLQVWHHPGIDEGWLGQHECWQIHLEISSILKAMGMVCTTMYGPRIPTWFLGLPLMLLGELLITRPLVVQGR